MGVVVRDLVNDDREAICGLLQSGGAFTVEEIEIALELVDHAIAHGRSGDYIAFVTARNGEVCGYVCVGRTPMTRSTWHLYWLCVATTIRGAGIGRALAAHAEAFVSSSGGERLVLETSSQSSYAGTRHFYENCGYTQVGRIRDFYKADDDCLIYCKELAAGAAGSARSSTGSARSR
jgi:ribosomal protein S18 acetylase RimI-like enzyme